MVWSRIEGKSERSESGRDINDDGDVCGLCDRNGGMAVVTGIEKPSSLSRRMAFFL